MIAGTSVANWRAVLGGTSANAVVTVGLLPSVWLVRRVPIWCCVAFGVAAVIALPFILL